MPGSGKAEIYFIAAMMILILILSVAAIYIFFKTYKKEMREKALHKEAETRSVVPITDDPKSEI